MAARSPLADPGTAVSSSPVANQRGTTAIYRNTVEPAATDPVRPRDGHRSAIGARSSCNGPPREGEDGSKRPRDSQPEPAARHMARADKLSIASSSLAFGQSRRSAPGNRPLPKDRAGVPAEADTTSGCASMALRAGAAAHHRRRSEEAVSGHRNRFLPPLLISRSC